jgi:hypothetical protein
MIGKILTKTSFNTQATLIDRTCCITLDVNDFIATGTKVYGTTHTTVRTYGLYLTGCLLGFFCDQGTGWTPGQALTTGFANRFQKGFIIEGTYLGIIPPAYQVNRSDTGYLITSTDTLATEDTLIWITIKSRMLGVYW